MALCPQCGKQFDDANAFCPYCGAAVNAQNQQSAQQNNSFDPNAAQPQGFDPNAGADAGNAGGDGTYYNADYEDKTGE